MTSQREFGFKDPRYEEFPPVVQMALVSGICPSHCEYCPVGNGSIPMKQLLFDEGLFQRLADEVAAHPWAILRIHSRGEPMSHPRYAPMIAYAKQRGVGTVTSFTNGIYLSRRVEQLLDAGIDLVEISADAADAALYRRWRRDEYFDDVVEGVRRLFEARNRRPGSKTRIVVSAVDHPEFRPHRPAFEKFWGGLCDKVLVRPFHTYGGLIADPYGRVRPAADYIPCVQLWERFSVNTEGLVTACFNDWKDEDVVGDLRRRGASIAAVWQSRAFREIRGKSLAGPCVRCCFKCSGPSLSSWGSSGYQYWVRELLGTPVPARQEVV